MRIWLKYIIGIGIGIATAIILPADSAQAQAALTFLYELVIRFGRYTLLPLLFFSVATACFKLNEEKLVLKTGAWTFGLIIGSSLLLVVLGLLSALMFRLPRIPVSIEKGTELPVLSIKALLTQLFPYSGFEAVLNGAYLLPCFIFAGLAGAGASSERAASKTAFSIFDSLSRVCYNVMSFFTEFLAVGMIAITCRWCIDFFAVTKSGLYTPLLMLIAADFVLVAFILYPVILRFVFREQHPYRVLYASICPVLVAFFSGDTNLTLQLNMRHGKESLGIQRRINAVTFPLFSIFGRGGAALVQAVCFVNIWRSYALEMDYKVALWIGVMSFLLSFVLCDRPSGGPFVAVTLMCLMFGSGYEAGYLLLRDAAPILCACAAGFDAVTAMFGSYIVALRTERYERMEIRHFI